MESLSPFPQGSFIPCNMPVYPGALRIAGDNRRLRNIPLRSVEALLFAQLYERLNLALC